MASIEKRTTAKGEPRWELRYRVKGREVSRTFRTRTDAVNYRRQVEHDELRGAAFDPRAGGNSPRMVIINEAMAERYWPKRDPIGARLVIEENGGSPAEVIGIVRNSKYGSMSEPSTPFLYRSYYQGD